MHCLIRTDGGARGNPGPAGIGVVIENADTGEIVEKHSRFLGKTTNNQAEYRAAILGLERCLHLHANEVDVLADSELLVKQANGTYRVKHPDLALRFAELKRLEARFKIVRYRHVRREQNKLADKLANEAMDRGKDMRIVV